MLLLGAITDRCNFCIQKVHFYFATKNLQRLQIKVGVVKDLQELQLFAALQLHSGCKDLQCSSNTLNIVIKSCSDILDDTLEVSKKIIGGAAVLKFQNKV